MLDPKHLLQILSPMLSLMAGLLFALATVLKYAGTGRVYFLYLCLSLFWFAFALLQYSLIVRRK